MSMVKWSYLSGLVLTLVIASCANVGRISGGDKDVVAPKVDEKSFKPKNGTTHFSEKSIEITFDEFVKLNNPGQSIKMIPGNAKVDASVVGKKVKLSWEDTLADNTTYAIYLNKTIQDITESNDSLMQYVFSTGNTIDSLSLKVLVKDAWKNTPEKGLIAVLKDVKTGKVVSFSESDDRGQITLNYLKPNKYSLLVFDDIDQDFIADDFERVGFPVWKEIDLKESIYDTIPINVFDQPQSHKVRTVKYIHPGVIALGLNHEVKDFKLFYNDKRLNKIKMESKDSILAFVNVEKSNKINSLRFVSKTVNDTLSVRITPKNVDLKMSPSTANKQFLPNQDFEIICGDWITSLDTSKVRIMRARDSVYFQAKWSFIENRIFIQSDSIQRGQFVLHLDDDAVKSVNSTSKSKRFIFMKNDETDYGKLILDIKGYSNPLVLVLMKNKKVIRQIVVKNPNKSLIVDELPAGAYSFKIVQDANSNGKWDSGDLNKRIQPELVDEYSKTVKVRTNWDIELTIERVYE